MAVERALYVRERNDGMYRPVVYLLYKMLDEFLLMVPVTAVSTAIMFLGCKLQGSFLLFWLVTLFTLANGTGVPACCQGWDGHASPALGWMVHVCTCAAPLRSKPG